jgi:hypothetical protein
LNFDDPPQKVKKKQTYGQDAFADDNNDGFGDDDDDNFDQFNSKGDSDNDDF